jgi:hypothetical protein
MHYLIQMKRCRPAKSQACSGRYEIIIINVVNSFAIHRLLWWSSFHRTCLFVCHDDMQARRKLLDFLRSSEFYDAEALLEFAQETELHDEIIILNAKLERYQEVLEV